MKKLLVIGKNWPEPKTTAAGYRILQLLKIFQNDNYHIHFCSAAQKSKFSFDLETINIQEHPILLNDNSFDEFVKELQPDAVMFDRFMIEEQYGWRVRENSSKSIHILDTEDLHFLRKAREVALKRKQDIDLYNETAMREIASILRCDLNIIISSVEIEILENQFDISKSKLVHIPFLYDGLNNERLTNNKKTFLERSNFIMIGNSLHQPNYDSILFMKKEIWPQIRLKLPHAEVHIYGAYQTDKITQLNNVKEGFIIKGFAINAHEVLSKYKILLAPLRFGAGLKGKIFDALHASTPVAMSSIAAEGMFNNSQPYGFIQDDIIKYSESCIDLYRSEELWNQLSVKNIEILERNYSYSAFAKALLKKVSDLDYRPFAEISNQKQFYIQMQNYHSYKATKYLSKWIEVKNK